MTVMRGVVEGQCLSFEAEDLNQLNSITCFDWAPTSGITQVLIFFNEACAPLRGSWQRPLSSTNSWSVIDRQCHCRSEFT